MDDPTPSPAGLDHRLTRWTRPGWRRKTAVGGCTALFVAAGVFVVARPPGPLPPIQHPRDNPPNAARIDLGRRLFFDKRLSRGDQVSCATCHDPNQGWSDGRQVATGVDGAQGTRNTPTLINVGYNRLQFWDGRAGSLEEQALGPIQNPLEMDMPLDKLVAKLDAVPEYRRRFQEAFGSKPTADAVAKAIASYERTIVSRDLPIDRFHRGENNALSSAARRGMRLFHGRARCVVCHRGPNLTDDRFHNIGVGVESPDLGREQATKRAEDRRAFKTPTLREVARSAPYMHDGSFKTLEEVVRHYNFGGVVDAANDHRDEELEVLYLSEDEAADLVVFLKEGLSSSVPPTLHRPPAK
ncbi:MAG: cytochrome-c peroxidase [Planctomycetales bacterium]